MKNVYLFICMIWMTGCTNDERKETSSIMQSGTKGPVTGVWIESQNRTDTLDFDQLAPTSFMFGRGTEIINGFKKDKFGIGFYQYSVQNNKISLQWCFSSIISKEEYYFEQLTDTIVIENFYDKHLKGNREIFVKLK